MAEKRMFSRKITNHDNFTSLPATTQALYFHLVMDADDDGFCDRTNIAIGNAHAKKKDLDLLVKLHYVIKFDSGVYAIKHWNMQNTIRQDRHTPTEYQDEFLRLKVKPNGAYAMPSDSQTADITEANGYQNDGHMTANPQPSDSQTADTCQQNAALDLGIGLDLVLNNTAPVMRARACEEAQNDLGRVMTFFRNRLNPTPSQMAIDMLKGFTKDLGADVVLHALQIAVDERKTGWRYIQGILQSYKSNGLTDMDAVLRAELEYAERGKGGGRSRNTGQSENGADGAQFNIRYDVEG